MKRLIALSLLLAPAACVDNRSSIEIDGRAAPTDLTTCKFAPGGDVLSGAGLLDVGVSMPTYDLEVYLKNDLSNPATASTPVIGQIPTVISSTKAWTANAAKVRVNPSGYVDTFGPNPSLLQFNGENVTPLDGQTIQPGGGTAVQLVEAISGPLGAQLTSLVAPGDLRRIVLGISLQGRTLDGASLDTSEWYFPLDLCNGCLTCPAGQVPSSAGCVACPTGQVPTAQSCFGFGQDSAAICATPIAQ